MLENVRLVEIEIHSMCNRKCSWCPNSKLDRGFYKTMPERTYINLLHELKENNFNGTITYSRYNEPMADINLLKTRVAQAKDILPHVKRVSNTNGDYLSKENLEGLLIDELTIMDYDCIGIIPGIDKLIDSGVKITKVKDPYIYGEFKDMKILYYSNWTEVAELEDRGGFFKESISFFHKEKNKVMKINWKEERDERTEPCFEPIYFIGIDYNGEVVPCCQIRSDNNDHKNLLLGNINFNSIGDIYNSKKAIKFRNDMAIMNTGNICKACLTCQKGQGRYTRDNASIKY